MKEIYIGLIALAGVIIGGLLQFLFNRFSSKSDFERNTELKAYMLYLEAVSGITICQNSTDQDGYMKNLKLLTEAKAKIAIVGSNNTINALVNFEKNGPVVKDIKSKKLFINIINSMRDSLRKNDKVLVNDITILITGLENQ